MTKWRLIAVALALAIAGTLSILFGRPNVDAAARICLKPAAA